MAGIAKRGAALDALTGREGSLAAVEDAVRAVDPRLRLAAPEDRRELFRLHNELAAIEWSEIPPRMDAGLGSFLAKDTASFVVVAERGEPTRPAARGAAKRATPDPAGLGGFVVVHALPALAEGAVQLFLDDIYVEDELRGTGLGGKLLAAAEAAGKSLGAVMTFLHARKENEVARRFYAKHGLAPTDDIVFERG